MAGTLSPLVDRRSPDPCGRRLHGRPGTAYCPGDVESTSTSSGGGPMLKATRIVIRLVAVGPAIILASCGSAPRGSRASTKAEPASSTSGATGDPAAISTCTATAKTAAGAESVAAGYTTTVGAFMAWRQSQQAAAAAADLYQPRDAPDYP